MKLAPHMIQSMEILQLPILALQERIEQELNSNPVLEMEEPSAEEETSAEQTADTAAEAEVTPQTTVNQPEDFKKAETLDEEFKDYIDKDYAEQDLPPRPRVSSDEPDMKLEAIKNAAAPPESLHEFLEDQWRLVEADEPVKRAGDVIIDYIDDKGYLSVRLEQLHSKDNTQFTLDDLNKALGLIQKLEPPGVGARDLKECLLIQMAQSSDDMDFEMRLVSEYMDDLLQNRLPDIAEKMKCTVEQINHAVHRLSKFDTSPGLQIGRNTNHPVTADVIVECSEDTGDYTVRLADYSIPRLRVSDYYAKMVRSDKVAENTKQFLQNNIRSAQWIIDAIEQRKNTLLNVTKAVVKYQRDFFDKGQLYLKPLPMSKVAEDVRVHIATVSRAAAGKYVQCSWGILPLRKFFSGGLEDVNGREHSWQAVRAKLQQIIDEEDKAKPLSDEQIRTKLAEAGITGLARRTVAKYRGLLNVPTAKFRKKY
jgi:RNA polymerase sigma-54 factor